MQINQELKIIDMAYSVEDVIDEKIRDNLSYKEIEGYIDHVWAIESTKEEARSYLYKCKCLRLVE